MEPCQFWPSSESNFRGTWDSYLPGYRVSAHRTRLKCHSCDNTCDATTRRHHKMKPSATTLDKDRSALLIVDIQTDFLPGGSLPVGGGDEIVAPIADLMTADLFQITVATQDWHPPEHISFASNHPGKKPFDRIDLYGHEQILWPDHCVQGTDG